MRICRTGQSGRRRFARRQLVVALLIALSGAESSGAQGRRPSPLDGVVGTTRYDPGLRFQTISTPRFDIHFHQGEEALARRLAGFVDDVASEVDARLGAPHGRVHVVLVDQSDVPNGWATVFPFNLIELAAAPPVSTSTIGNTSDWLRTVFSHEYTHVVHLEKGRGWIGGLRHVFGRLPVLAPNMFLPEWQVEGIATYEEGVVTAGGRVPAGDFRMILDRAAAEHRFAPLDRAGAGMVDWPSGNTPYVYGAYFHDYLVRRYGAESLARLSDATAGRLPYFGARALRGVFGRSLGALWKDFATDATARLAIDPDPVSATRLTTHGFIVGGPSFSPAGRLYYSIVNPHDFPALMELPGGGSSPRRVASRYLGDRVAATRDHLVFNQQEVVHHADLQSDLYAVALDGGPTRRLTREARAADPDVAPDGHTIVCTVQTTGRRFLGTLQMPSRGALARPAPLASEESTEFSAPRWSPDGRFVAAERRRLGGPSEIVVIDAATGDVRTLLSSRRGRNVGPMWLRDGATILFSSDRDGGPFFIYGVDVTTGAVRRLLGTGPGARSPTLSPDGHRLVFVGYTADGYDLYSLPFDAPRWSSVLAAVPQAPTLPQMEVDRAPLITGLPARPYRPWSTLAPRYWAPVVESRRDDLLVGASTSGFDALGRHAYLVTGTWAVPRNTASWEADYSYSRWWPTLFAGASDTVDDWRSGEVRSRELRAGALLPVRRVRWRTAALAAIQASRDDFDCPACATPAGGTARLTALQLGWTLSSARSFGYSISPEQGGSVSVTTEMRRTGAGDDGRAGAATADMRGYIRVWPRHGVVAVRTAAATTWGDPAIRRVFDAGGSGPQVTGFAFGTGAVGLLRGFGTADLYGFHAAVVNLDYRFPLAWPQRGVGTLPLMLRKVHGALFVDAGNAWDGSFRLADVRRAYGAELSADTLLGEALPLTVTAGGAWRDDPSGRRPGWAAFARVGRAF